MKKNFVWEDSNTGNEGESDKTKNIIYRFFFTWCNLYSIHLSVTIVWHDPEVSISDEKSSEVCSAGTLTGIITYGFEVSNNE